MPFGSEMAVAPDLNKLERVYIQLFGWPAVGLRIRAQRLLPIIETYLGGVRDVLDAGCGKGVFTLALARRYPQIRFEGIDLEIDLVEKGQQMAKILKLGNIRFSQGNLIKLDRQEEFDMILNIDCIEHIEKDDQVLENMFNSLRPSGILILHTPTLYRRFLGRTTMNLDIDSHVRPGYIEEELVELMVRSGFSVKKIHSVYGFWETSAQSVSYCISGAKMKNAALYGLLFPFLRSMAWLGKSSRPSPGNGLVVVAIKPES